MYCSYEAYPFAIYVVKLIRKKVKSFTFLRIYILLVQLNVITLDLFGFAIRPTALDLAISSNFVVFGCSGLYSANRMNEGTRK